jgi:hypothetical protein
MNPFERIVDTDLLVGAKTVDLGTIMYQGDNNSHVLGARVWKGRTQQTISGTIKGYVVRRDGVTVPYDGEIVNNAGVITLGKNAFNVPGHIDITVKVNTESDEITIASYTGTVKTTQSNAVVDPENIIPDLNTLLAQIDNMAAGTTAANNAASLANTKAGLADTAATRANASASAVENMTATAETLSPGSSATTDVTQSGGHYVIGFGIPKGDTGDNASITNTITHYQNSSSGTTIPSDEWSTQQPATAQGDFLWIRTTYTWNNGQTTYQYSVSRQGVDGTGSVSSVNNISPDNTGNVTLPIDGTPTLESNNPVKSGGVYTAIRNAVDPISNVVTEIPLSIGASSWSSSSPYTYTWTDSRVLSDSSVEVDILNTSADTTAEYLDYAKASGGGGIVFTANKKPTASISVIITITNAQAHAGSSIDADTVATDAISGAENVDEALTKLNDRIGIKDVTYTVASTSVNGKTQMYAYVAVQSGYTPISAYFVPGSGISTVFILSNPVVSSSQVVCRMFNPNDQAVTIAGTLHVLFAKNAMIES